MDCESEIFKQSCKKICEENNLMRNFLYNNRDLKRSENFKRDKTILIEKFSETESGLVPIEGNSRLISSTKSLHGLIKEKFAEKIGLFGKIDISSNFSCVSRIRNILDVYTI